jgi:hypothetical protein
LWSQVRQLRRPGVKDELACAVLTAAAVRDPELRGAVIAVRFRR